MAAATDFTLDPGRRSWVASAGNEDTDFPLQNLPLGVFRRASETTGRIGVAIGDCILDLRATAEAGLMPSSLATLVTQPTLNGLMAAGAPPRVELRRCVSLWLGPESCDAQTRSQVGACLLPMHAVAMQLPCRIGDFTDFYASSHHATNVGRMFRPDEPLLPNYKWIPIGYHGRASSIVPSGTAVRRPRGQLKPSAGAPVYAPTERLDFEVELGAFVGPGNELGTSIPIGAAAGHLFGVVLLNDWSARDIQAWEYQPLGPFLAKSFATTISPWVVTMEALAPFRVPRPDRSPSDPSPLRYLDDERDASAGVFDIDVTAWVLTSRMRSQDVTPQPVTRTNVRGLYWTFAQLVAHQTSNGCNLQAGDLLGTGTLSGRDAGAWGSLLEITHAGRETLEFPTGEKRTFLADGDEVVFRARAARAGFKSIGFGECRGMVLPAIHGDNSGV